MLNTLNNVDTVHRQQRILTYVCVVLFVVGTAYMYTHTTNLVREQSRLVYANIGGSLIQLTPADEREYLPIQSKAHVELFHTIFYDLDPDPAAIDRQLARSLVLGDATVRELHDRYQEDQFYRNLVASNLSQDITVDSVAVDLSTDPFHFTFHGKLTLTRPTTVTERTLVTEGYLRQVKMTEDNPYGFLIERYQVIENDDLGTKRRY